VLLNFVPLGLDRSLFYINSAHQVWE